MGYVKNRNIADNIRTVADLLHHTKLQQLPGILINIDFKKAFDSLDWIFLKLILEKFNFGATFINWIQTLYQGSSSCIINKGVTSEYFLLGRGVRQGDPLSPYLFILAVEILASIIRQENRIKGFTFQNQEVKLLQYADDTTGILADIKSARLFLEVVEEFGTFSGLKLNREKTEGMWIGSKHTESSRPLGISWPNKPLRFLGVYVGYDEEACNALNFESRIHKCRQIMGMWQRRNLTFQGRIQIIKTFIISQFLFTMSATVIPDKYIKEINAMMFKFIWKGKRERIKRSILMVRAARVAWLNIQWRWNMFGNLHLKVFEQL